MKFIVSWTLPQASYRDALNKFLASGGLPPANIKMLGRWHGMDGTGFAIAETDDPKALYAWYAEWLEFLPIATTPCLEDGDAAAVLQLLKR
ncbi:MAG TPA: DUF3303 family protein [Alloacidobacterium sp.]|nr:DUF3303 family protein [Alloacidobacterium sp.]